MKTVFVVKKDSPLKEIKSIDHVKGYRVGFIKNVYQTEFVSSHADQLSMEYLYGEDWIKINLKKLIKGRLDAIYDLNEYTQLYEATLLSVADQIKVLPLPESPRAIYVVFSKKTKNGKELVEKYNAVCNEVDFTGFIEQEFELLKNKNSSVLPHAPEHHVKGSYKGGTPF